MVGWDYYLLEQRNSAYRYASKDRKSVLVQIGGSDTDGVGEQLPRLLQQILPQDSQVHWVQGPYAPAPNLDAVEHLQWTTYHSPDDLSAIHQQCDVALVAYGVSLFELLMYGMPTVVVATSAGPDKEEWKAFKESSVAVAVESLQEAVNELSNVMVNSERREALHLLALEKMDGMGAQRLVDKVLQLSSQWSG